MTILQLILLGAALVMGLRQIMLMGNVWALLRRNGYCEIYPSWWIHFAVTVALILATVASFTGIRL